MQVCHIDVQAWFHRSTKSGFYFFTRDSYKMMKEISERCLKDINYNLSEFKSRLVYGGQSFVDTLYFFLNLFIIASINKFFTQKQIQQSIKSSNFINNNILCLPSSLPSSLPSTRRVVYYKKNNFSQSFIFIKLLGEYSANYSVNYSAKNITLLLLKLKFFIFCLVCFSVRNFLK